MDWRRPALRRLIELIAFSLLALALAMPFADRGFHLLERLG
jgi:hypothetical protein